MDTLLYGVETKTILLSMNWRIQFENTKPNYLKIAMKWLKTLKYTLFLTTRKLTLVIDKNVKSTKTTKRHLYSSHDKDQDGTQVLHITICDRPCENRPCSHLVVIRETPV